MSPFLAVDSGTDSIRGQFVEHLLMLSTWAACGRAGEPFPDHHLSLDPAPPGNLCSTQDPEIDAHQPRGRLQSLFLLAPHIWLHTQPISDCTSLIPTNFSFTTYFQATNLQATRLPPQTAQLLTTASPEKTSPSTTTTTTETFESTSSEFEPTEAFPRLNCGGRGFYQVGFPFWNNLRTRL